MNTHSLALRPAKDSDPTQNKWMSVSCILLFQLTISTPVALAQDGEEVDGFEVQIPNFVSPPIIIEPIYACTDAIAVTGVVPGATVEVFVNQPSSGVPDGVAVAQEDPTSINVPALAVGDLIIARQIWNGMISADSAGASVANAEAAYPNGFPESRVDPPPLYECGRRTGSYEHLPGSKIDFFSQPSAGTGTYTPIGGGRAATAETSYFTLSPAFTVNEAITTQYSLCATTSPMSGEEIVQPEPSPILEPTIDEEVYDGMDTVWVDGAHNGARLEVYLNGTSPGDVIGARYTGASRARVWFSTNVNAGDQLFVTQELCNKSVPTTSIPVKPCSGLPAPVIRTPEIGDDFVVLLSAVAGARIEVFDASGVALGNGAGSKVRLNRAIRPGDELFVRQIAGNCTGATFWATEARCKKVDELGDPSSDGAFGIGELDYSIGDVTVGTTTTRVDAHVKFPVNPTGPENVLSQWGGEFPIVFILHGNHGIWRNPSLSEGAQNRDLCPDSSDPSRGPPDPSWNVEVENHRGYDYLMDALVKRGYIAVSIDGNDLNCRFDHIPERAELILEHIELWVDVYTNGGNFSQGDMFKGRVDMQDIGLLGHSRGGEAVVGAAVTSPFDPLTEAKITSVLSLAPVDFRGYTLEKIPLLMILPAADGDVVENSGAKIYDRSNSDGYPRWFRSQQYIYGANHNFFNSEWGYDDNSSGPSGAPLTRSQQEDVLRMMTRGFFDDTLYREKGGHGFLTGDAVLAGLPAEIYPSYARSGAFDVDRQENGDPYVNTLGLTVAESGFMVFSEESFDSGYNNTFYHDTSGLLVAWESSSQNYSSEVMTDVSTYEYLSFRITQAVDPLNRSHGSIPTTIGIGIEGGGGISRVNSADIGVIPYPYDHGTADKSMMRTLRVPTACLSQVVNDREVVDLQNLQKVIFDTDSRSSGVLGFDQLSFTE